MKPIHIILNAILLLGTMHLCSACHGQNPTPPDKETIHSGTTVSAIGKSIRSIFQDKQGNYWFGTDGEGLYRYDGKKLTLFTQQDGLSHNQIQMIQEDQSGNTWFDTGNGITRFDGKKFTILTNDGNRQTITQSQNWKIAPNDLWFDAPGGVYRIEGNDLNYFRFPQTKSDSIFYAQNPYNPDPYALYSILKDRKGNLWFGTEARGVIRYDGKSFQNFNEDGLDGAAIRAIFEDRDGNVWFGNNGLGIYRYDGTKTTNFTEAKGLSNPNYVKAIKEKTGNMSRHTSREGTLSSIMAITQDLNGNLWFGTYDSGAWRYDGKQLTNYTTKDGLPSNAVMAIYEDHNGILWFGTDGAGVCKFDGKTFIQFTGNN